MSVSNDKSSFNREKNNPIAYGEIKKSGRTSITVTKNNSHYRNSIVSMDPVQPEDIIH